MNREIEYDPLRDGAVVAIKIYGIPTPRAILAFAFGGTVDVEWNIVSEREKYEKGINSYTYVFDERPAEIGRTFDSFVKNKD